MIYVTRNSFARYTIRSERAYTDTACTWCGSFRTTPSGKSWAYRFYVDDDCERNSGYIAKR